MTATEAGYCEVINSLFFKERILNTLEDFGVHPSYELNSFNRMQSPLKRFLVKDVDITFNKHEVIILFIFLEEIGLFVVIGKQDVIQTIIEVSVDEFGKFFHGSILGFYFDDLSVEVLFEGSIHEPCHPVVFQVAAQAKGEEFVIIVKDKSVLRHGSELEGFTRRFGRGLLGFFLGALLAGSDQDLVHHNGAGEHAF